jgi:hypothetical protein
MHETPSISAKGLVRSLYDFKFTSLIAQRVIRFFYGLIVVLISLVSVIAFIALLSRGGAGVGIAIVVVPIYYFISLIYARVGVEFLIVFFQIGEDVRAMRIGKTGAAPAQTVSPISAPQVSPPGWHADTTDPTRERFWDGSKWTDQYRPRGFTS